MTEIKKIYEKWMFDVTTMSKNIQSICSRGSVGTELANATGPRARHLILIIRNEKIELRFVAPLFTFKQKLKRTNAFV